MSPAPVRCGRTAAVLAAGVALIAVAVLVTAHPWSRAMAGPSGPDYIDIDDVADPPADPAAITGAATGTYAWSCGHNEQRHLNAANVVVAPGIPGPAHHVHDYVGNLSTDVDSTDASLAAATTSCANGDLSTYYWPVLRAPAARSGDVHDVGAIQQPVSVTLIYLGNPVSPVLPMPRFLRGQTGDAHAVGGSGALARPDWTCSSAPRKRTGRYPRCPAGDQVLRVYEFPSCWDGRRTDSVDHRAQLTFPGAGDACPHGTFAVPRLRVTVAYQLPAGTSYDIDSFPDQNRSPVSDHSLFVNVMPEALMTQVVTCLNAGRECR
jgi:hypothetical protein